MVNPTNFKTFLLTLSAVFIVRGCSGYVTEEAALRTQLLANYSASVRPNKTITITLQFLPLFLNELNIAEQRMSLSGVMTMIWQDWRLAWDPGEYDDITEIILDPKDTWTPVIIVENAVQDMAILGAKTETRVNPRVVYNGLIYWSPPVDMSVSCQVRISYYPFDTQECFARFTSWALNTREANFSVGGSYLEYFTPNGEWSLLGTWTKTDYFKDGQGGGFPRVDFVFKFRREWQFYAMNMLFPLMGLSALMCAVFALPIESGEKMGFSLTVLLSYVVFLTWVTDKLPAVSTDTCVLQVFVSLTLTIGSVATVLCTWVLHLHHRSPAEPMSSALRFFVRKVLIPLRSCTSSSKHRINSGNENSDVARQAASHAKKTGSLFRVSRSLSSYTGPRIPSLKVAPHDTEKEERRRRKVGEESAENDVDNADLVSMSESQEPEEEEVTWPEVAAMMDRFLALVITSVTILSNVLIVGLLYGKY